MYRPLVSLLAAAFLGPAVLAREVEETYASGQVKLRYSVDAEGRKEGVSVEYYENGKVRVRAEYRADQLDGTYATFHENGKPNVSAAYRKGKLEGDYTERTAEGKPRVTAGYREGKLHGWRTGYLQGEVVHAQFWKDGVVLAHRGPEQIKSKLADIEREPDDKAKLDSLARNREAGLRRLKAYRYLAAVPYDDLEMDDELTRYAQAASDICARIGKMEHTPANPGMPEDEYKFAYKGTSSSNLFWNLTDFPKCIDGWMDDSDPSNIDRLGHRRWCLNPELKKVGFGRKGVFAAMYAFDASRKEVPDYDFVCWPPPGVAPAAYCGSKHAWSLSVNPGKYRQPGDSVSVKVTALDRNYDPAGEPLELAVSRVDTEGYGIPNCIIFRPRKVDATAGRYWVEIDGLQTRDGKPAPVRYLIEFASLK